MDQMPQYNPNNSEMYGYGQPPVPVRGRSFISPSMILGGISSILILIGSLIPMMDFSTFHEKIQIRYNIYKICKNVGMISPTWRGIAVGIVLVAILYMALSFVDIPILKLIPSLIGIAMLVIMFVDGAHVLDWARETVDMYFKKDTIVINMTQVYKSLRAGIYLIATGILTGLVSCFLPGRKYE